MEGASVVLGRVGKTAQAESFSILFARAHAAGMAAGAGLVPRPMVVRECEPLGKSWYVPEGVCGFAWVTVRPGNCSFANWLKKTKNGDTAYGGGVQVWVSQFGQSMEKKEAYANAFAAVIKAAGITAYSGSRMD